MKQKLVKMDLRLFEGEGGAGAAAGSAPQVSGASAPPDSGPDGNTGTESSAEPQEKTPEERQAAYERFKKEYSDLYGSDVKAQIDRRVKDEQKLYDQLAEYEPLVGILSERYGIENANVAKIMEAIDQDNSFWEEQAVKANMTVDQLKRMRKIEAQNRQLLESAQRAQQVRQREDVYERWDREAELCRQRYPGFDMMKECENPLFQRALGAGMDVETAYRAVHFDELTRGMMVQTERDTKKKVADAIRSGNGRPAENGVGAGAANGTKVSAWELSKEEFHKVMERVARGEEIVI